MFDSNEKVLKYTLLKKKIRNCDRNIKKTFFFVVALIYKWDYLMLSGSSILSGEKSIAYIFSFFGRSQGTGYSVLGKIKNGFLGHFKLN